MADITRADRVLQLFALLITNPSRSYSISDLMEALEIPENERRNVQRDMQTLTSANGGAYIRVLSDRRAFRYQSAIKSADNLLFPNFENTMLHFVFLQRIANMYPAASETVTDLLEKIRKSLPASGKKAVDQLAQDLNSRILFAGTPPMFEEDSSEKLKVILQAIHERRKIRVAYVSENGNIPSIRIPLMVILYQGEIYIGCESQSHRSRILAILIRSSSAESRRSNLPRKPFRTIRKRLKCCASACDSDPRFLVRKTRKPKTWKSCSVAMCSAILKKNHSNVR